MIAQRYGLAFLVLIGLCFISVLVQASSRRGDISGSAIALSRSSIDADEDIDFSLGE